MSKFKIAILLPFICSPLIALAMNNKVECPEAGITKIAATYLDSVTRYENPSEIKYRIFSDSQKFSINNLSWGFYTEYNSMSLKDYDKAFTEGQATLNKNLKLSKKYPLDDGQTYWCGYSDEKGNIVAVGYATHKDNNSIDKINNLIKTASN